MNATEDSVSERDCYMEMIHLHHDLFHELQRKLTELSTRLDVLALHTSRMESLLWTMEYFLNRMERCIENLEQKLAGIVRHLEQFGLQPNESHINAYTARM